MLAPRTPTAVSVALLVAGACSGPRGYAQSLDPHDIPKYVDPLVIPPVMPSVAANHYEIAVRQFEQRILPSTGWGSLGTDPYPTTTVWGYGSVAHPGTVAQGGTFHYPAFTVEARWSVPVTVRWINGLVDAGGNFLPHLLPVDRTLHWANPELLVCMDGNRHTDCRPDAMQTSTADLRQPYDGPVPIVTHVHGAETFQDSDGYPEAWYLPAAADLPAGYARAGRLYGELQGSSPLGALWEPGSAVFRYPNMQRPTTLWYHDHALGMTRLNVYAGPAGFYLLRGGPDGDADDARTPRRGDGVLPGPAPARGQGAVPLNTPGDPVRSSIREIPIAIQDRSFDADGSLFYPDSRTHFDGFAGPFFPDEVSLESILGISDVPPIWNPEFFGNTIVVNGRTWPRLDVARALYRLRLLNGSQSRFLILELDHADVEVWQIGAEGGFLPAPVNLREAVQAPLRPGQILLGPAERADVLVDFRGLADGTEILVRNLGPDEPFGGGVPGADFPVADPATTGQVMKLVVRAALDGASPTDPTGATPATDPEHLALPGRRASADATRTQRLSLNEEMSRFAEDLPAFDVPVAALLGTLDPAGPTPLPWHGAITEQPTAGTTEIWELWNFTADAHPIHIHLVQFEVLDRAVQDDPEATSVAGTNGPLPWERGTKDTVIVYPGEVTRVKAHFPLPGLFVWHCHILEHEDNEMMRPYCIRNVSGSRPGTCDVADGSSASR